MPQNGPIECSIVGPVKEIASAVGKKFIIPLLCCQIPQQNIPQQYIMRIKCRVAWMEVDFDRRPRNRKFHSDGTLSSGVILFLFGDFSCLFEGNRTKR